jgi:ABC-type sugar transport system permease subunit
MTVLTRSAPKDATQRSLTHTLRRMRKYWFCYVMLAGTFALLITFSYLPALSAAYHSFTVWDGFRSARWIGLENYKEIVESADIRRSALSMLVLVLWQIGCAVTVPLLAAALIYRLRSERLAAFFRLSFVLPIVVPATVSILVWRQIYDPNVGLLNEILMIFGLPPSAWLNNARTALASLMFIGFP